jgi:hypothetical protein
VQRNPKQVALEVVLGENEGRRVGAGPQNIISGTLSLYAALDVKTGQVHGNAIARTRVLHAGDGSGWAGSFLLLFGSVVKTFYQVNQAVSKLAWNGTFGCLLIDLPNCSAHLVGASLALSESWVLAVRGAVQDVDQSRPSEPITQHCGERSIICGSTE